MYRDPRNRPAGANGSRRRHRAKPSITSVMDNFRDGPNKNQQPAAGGASPDSKCPICLDNFENVAFLDHCWHKFCFCCIQEWSKNKAECPLCKQPFYSIIHTMRTDNDFKVYTVRPSDTAYSANPERRRFRYRTTMTGERRASVYQRSSSARRTVSPPDNGVLFEGLSTQTTRERNADMHHMIRRLASRRQAILEGRTTRQIQEQEMINFRRALYRSGIRVRSVEDGGRYRDTSAEFFRRNPACLHRLVPWLKRELTVLFGSHGSLVNIVQHVVMSNVTRYDIDSQAFADDLKPFLLHSTVHFLHEFITFARSPFNMEAYDQHANYDCPAPSYEEGSPSDSSIIIISPEGVGDQGPVLSAFSRGLEQAEWDDETPGPSYSSSGHVRTATCTTLDSSESSNGESELQTEIPAILGMHGDSWDSSDSCVIIGYVKPLAERTPELVQLSSDSEESFDGAQPEDVPEVEPIQYHSFSDTDARGYASPFSDQSRDDSVCKRKRSEKEKSQARDSSRRTELEKSAKRNYDDDDDDEDDDGYGLSKRRRYGSCGRRSRSRERHSLKSKRKHRGMEKRKRKRDSSRHKHRKEKKKSRTRDRSLSRKSQSHSLSGESTELRDQSRSRSHSKEKCKRKTKYNDYDSVRNDSYAWDCTPYSRNESPYRRQTSGRSQYSRPSGSPGHLVDLPNDLSEYMDSQNPRSRTENGYSNYDRRGSRSRSSSRSRTPPRREERTKSEKSSGKRKSKTNHLEETHEESKATLTREKALPEKPLPKYQDIYKKIGSLLEKHAESQHRKRKKMSRSPSVEIIFEGKPTDLVRHEEKKRKIEDKPKGHASCSSFASPVVITIDSDSDKTEWEGSISSSPLRPLNGRAVELPQFLESRDSSYDRTNEAESTDKDNSVTTTKKDITDGTPHGDLQAQGMASRHTPTLSDNCTLFDTGHQSSSVDNESLTQYPIVTSPLLLRLSRKLLEHSCPLDSEQKV